METRTKPKDARLFLAIGVLTFGIAILACSNVNLLRQLAPAKPDVSVSRVSFAGLSFDDMDLVFDFAVDNPNAFGISLSNFVYDLSINNSSLISGDKQDKLSIQAFKTSAVSLPVKLKYADLFNAV